MNIFINMDNKTLGIKTDTNKCWAVLWKQGMGMQCRRNKVDGDENHHVGALKRLSVFFHETLFEEYSDDPGNLGLILLSENEFDELAKKCYHFGFQLCTHAIGDKGNKLVLDTYQKYLNGKNDFRWRVEHAQMVRDEEISKFVNNDILPSMQPSHCTSDMRWLDERIGSERCSRISRWQSFVDAGLKIPGGSDCPIERGNPITIFSTLLSFIISKNRTQIIRKTY